jgi:hypothetical protein
MHKGMYEIEDLLMESLRTFEHMNIKKKLKKLTY